MSKVFWFKYNRVVLLDTTKRPFNPSNFYDGKIGGVPPKQIAKVAFKLKPVCLQRPVYAHCYNEVTVYNTQLSTEGSDGMLKKVATIWKLKDNSVIRWKKEQVRHLPPDYIKNLTKDIPERSERLPYYSRPVKEFSKFTRNKIVNKLQMWYLTELARNGWNDEKVKFNFWTFTVTQRQFSHELTALAWRNFLNNMKWYYGDKFQYLWVAELQTGKRSREQAKRYFDRWQAGIEPEKSKSLYEKFTTAALNPTLNIHYHLVVDRFYDLEILNHLWLTSLENVGASVFNEFGEKYRPVQLSKRYKNMPDGTWVERDFNCESLVRYVAKYLTKQADEDAGVEGIRSALWHCSRMVSKFATSVYGMLSETDNILKQIYMKDQDRINKGGGSDLTLC